MMGRDGRAGSGRRFDLCSPMDPRVAHAIARMEEAIDRDAPVAELASAVNLSPSRFAYLFRRETGMPPARYLHTLRMERARLLLERTFLSVKEVMAYVGVNDPSHFSRDFRRYHGVPPTGIRDRGWVADRRAGQRNPPADSRHGS
jgi:AraC family transcriptional regulator, arabinose operon regulatory protein